MLTFLFLVNSSFITHTAIKSTPSCSFFLFLTHTMASSSSSHNQIQELNAFEGLEPPGNRWKTSESSALYDVFINHRGPDVKQTLATQLYVSLEQLGIRAFLDSQEKELGNSFPSIIKTAIRSAKVHIAIFSKRYAESPWCLAELVQMLESKAKIIPVFYEVEPWELRHIEKGRYADAFIKYEENGRYLEKLSEWKEALQFLSFIAGEEFHSFSDCKNIVAAVQKELQRKRCLHVAKYPVGLHNLVEDFERKCLDEVVEDFERRCLEPVNQCGLEERRHKPNIVGIFGMGGSGKTTLAKQLFNRKHSCYYRRSFLFDVREASVRSELTSLQSQLLKDLFNENQGFRSIEEGTSCLNDHLQRKPSLNFLIVVDDIDHVEQLDALLIMRILDKSADSLVIVTTRDVGVLITAGITAGYRLTGMDRNHGRELFCWHAFGQPHPRSGYQMLVSKFVDVCGGLPLSLQVLGRHVHGRAHSYWQSELNKARITLPRDVKQRLRISFESLDDEQKHVFIDTACFFVGKLKSTAERVWERSGWNAQHALETLKDKCLVEEINPYGSIVLRMHDHLRDLGREMAHELSPPHRLWRPQDLQSLESKGFKTILTKTNMRYFNYFFDQSTHSKFAFFVGQADSFDEMSASLLWLQIEGNSTEIPSIPSWVPLQKLQFLKIKCGRFKTLWKNGKKVPSQLKELRISHSSLKEFPVFSGISCRLEKALLNVQGTSFTGMSSTVRAPMNELQKLKISHEECVSKILIDGMHYPSLQSIKLRNMKKLVEVDLRMVTTLNCLKITDCENLKRVSGISDLAKLVELEIFCCAKLEIEVLCLRRMRHPSLESIKLHNMKKLVEVDLRMVTTLNCLKITDCENLKSVSGISDLAKLVELEISDCGKLEIETLCLTGMNCLSLQSIKLHYMKKLVEMDLRVFETLNCLEITNCKNLKRVLGISNLVKLVELKISDCGKLEFEYLCLMGMKFLERITFDRNVMVKCFELDGCQNLKTMKFCCEKLVEFRIRGSPRLKEIPDFRGPSCLERIIIDECGIQDLILHNCKNLRSVSGNFQFAVLNIYDCPELEELPSPATLSRREFVIESCEKLELENIAGIEELHVQQYMRLRYCRNAIIRNCIHKLKSVPSKGMDMFGRAVDGAESSLNQNLFCEANIGVDGVIEIGTTDETYPNWAKLSFVIRCFVVVLDSSASALVNRFPQVYCNKLGQGEWVITSVAWDGCRHTYYKSVEDVLRRKGIMNKGVRVEVKKGEQWKGVGLLRTIVDKLYYL